MSAIFLAQWFCPCGQCYYQKVFKTTTWLPLTKLQSNKPHRNSPEPSRSCLRNLHQHTPELSGTFRNLPEPTPATHRNSPEPSRTCFRNLHQHTLELSGTTSTHRNFPEPASGTYTSTHRNSPEPSGTCLRNLLLRPAPEHTGAYLGWRPL